MTKREFLDRLERCLASLDAGERAAMVDFYSEQIDDRIDDGMTESQAVASLESPEDIAANILAQRAESQAQAKSGPSPTPAAENPSKPKGCLHTIGKVLLWTCAIIGILILLPFACGIACAVATAYLCLWVADLCLGVGALACMFIGALSIVACVVAPASGVLATVANVAVIALCLWVADLCLGVGALACMFIGALSIVACVVAPASGVLATVANVAVIAGFFGTTILLAIATYLFAKLLVMLVVWIVRAIKGRAGRARTTATVSAKEYPSMPMPPMAEKERPRRRMPLWGVAAIGSTVVVLASVCTVLGTIAVAGGPEGLAEQAGYSLKGETHSFDASVVDRIEISDAPQENGSRQGHYFYRVYLGVSADDQVHVVEPDGDVALMAWGSVVNADARQVGSTVNVTVGAHEGPIFANPVASLDTIAGGPYSNWLRVYVPQGWKGTISVNSATAQVEAMPFREAEEKLSIDGNLELHADNITLTGVDANAAELTADAVRLDGVSIEGELQVNEGKTLGWALLDGVEAKRGVFGGDQVHVIESEIGTIKAEAGTTVDGVLPDMYDRWEEPADEQA